MIRLEVHCNNKDIVENEYKINSNQSVNIKIKLKIIFYLLILNIIK